MKLLVHGGGLLKITGFLPDDVTASLVTKRNALRQQAEERAAIQT